MRRRSRPAAVAWASGLPPAPPRRAAHLVGGKVLGVERHDAAVGEVQELAVVQQVGLAAEERRKDGLHVAVAQDERQRVLGGQRGAQRQQSLVPGGGGRHHGGTQPLAGQHADRGGGGGSGRRAQRCHADHPRRPSAGRQAACVAPRAASRRRADAQPRHPRGRGAEHHAECGDGGRGLRALEAGVGAHSSPDVSRRRQTGHPGHAAWHTAGCASFACCEAVGALNSPGSPAAHLMQDY